MTAKLATWIVAVALLVPMGAVPVGGSGPGLMRREPQPLETDTTGAATDQKFQKHAQEEEHQGTSTLWTHPLVLGWILGFLLVGPDHIGTLMALSTLTSGFESFKRGFYWGAGHSIGVLLLCPIFLTLEYLTARSVSNESWEFYGNIFIGSSMIAVSAYFIYFQDSFLQKRADGTYVAKGCACHGSSSTSEGLSKATTQSLPMSNAADEAAALGICPPCSTSPKVGKLSKFKQLLARSSSGKVEESAAPKVFGNSLLGILQGLCCPIGMTAGTGFITRVTATASRPVLAGFMVEFFLASGIGSGLIAVGWGALTRSGSGSFISGKTVYLGTCSLLLVFGIVWLLALSLNLLDHIDFGDTIHDKIHEKLVAWR